MTEDTQPPNDEVDAMYTNTAANAAVQYREIGVSANVEDAHPAVLVYMLMDGAINRLMTVKGHMERNEIGKKGEMMSKAMAIIVELQRSLDFEKGGDFSTRMDMLYEYMLRRLVKANRHNDTGIIDEVVALLNPLRDAWHQVSKN